MRFARFLPFIFLLEACIDSYDLPTSLYVPQLVIGGMITNEPGPYEIILRMSSRLDSINPTPFPIENALVIISDDLGNSEVLTYAGTGKYVTQSIQGTVGRKYALNVVVNTKEYYTEPQELLPSGYLDSVYYHFRKGVLLPDDPRESPHALEIMLKSRGVANYPNLYRWTWRSTHELITQPEMHTTAYQPPCLALYGFCPPIIVPTPLKCSQHPKGCTCCKCWLKRPDYPTTISLDRVVNKSKTIFLSRLPADVYFFIRSHIEVVQWSVSEEGYRYWNLVKSQYEGNGSLFQPNNSKITGNIKSKEQNSIGVLGYFGVYGIVRKGFFIKPKDLPVKITPPPILPNSCASVYPGASYEKPDFWD